MLMRETGHRAIASDRYDGLFSNLSLPLRHAWGASIVFLHTNEARAREIPTRTRPPRPARAAFASYLNFFFKHQRSWHVSRVCTSPPETCIEKGRRETSEGTWIRQPVLTFLRPNSDRWVVHEKVTSADEGTRRLGTQAATHHCHGKHLPRWHGSWPIISRNPCRWSSSLGTGRKRKQKSKED